MASLARLQVQAVPQLIGSAADAGSTWLEFSTDERSTACAECSQSSHDTRCVDRHVEVQSPKAVWQEDVPKEEPKAAKDEPGAEPVKPPEPPPAPEHNLVIEFEDAGETKVFTFTRRPVGITFDHRKPVVVCEITPGTQGESFGIEKGWRIKKVAGAEVDDMDIMMCIKFLKEKAQRLPL